MLRLSVVNEMLGTMGESPLNSLDDPHTFLGAALNMLDKNDATIQARGWWFNTEDITLPPSALDSAIYLPGDTISVNVYPTLGGASTSNIVQRGRRLYNTNGGTYVFASPVRVSLKRRVDFEDMPETAAQYIASLALLQFQSLYDGDTAKSRELSSRVNGPAGTFQAIQREHTRESQANLLRSNPRLQRLKSITRGVRAQIPRG